MRWIQTALLVAVASFVAAPLHAQSEIGRPLTLDEAIRLGRANNRDLKVTREHLVQVRTDVQRAFASLLPTVAAQGKYTLNNKEITVSFTPGPLQALAQKLQTESILDLYAQSPKGPSAQVVADTQALSSFCINNPTSTECSTAPIVIQQQNQLDFIANAAIPIIVPFAYHGLRSARETYDAQVKTAEATEATLLQTVAQSFYAAAGNDELVVARRHGIEVAQQTLDNAKARLEAGVANRVDVTRAEIALVRARQALREQEDLAASAYRGLATLIQLREAFHVVAAEAPPPVGEPNDVLIAEGLKLRPELKSYQLLIASGQDAATSARLRWVPSLSGFAVFRGFSASGFAGDHFAWALGLQVDWQIYDGGLRQAQATQSMSVAREAAIRKAQFRDQLSDDVVNLRAQLETRRAAVESALREVTLATETLALTRVQRDAGTATQLDLLQAQDALITAEVAVARARFDLGLTGIQLRRATGDFPSSIQ